MRTDQNKKSWIGALVVLLVLFVLITNSWADPLVINYSNLTMSFGSSQNLSASGGCPPYTWTLFGGGTLTPSGGYTAPASNSNCANNAMIVLTDSCGNTADIKIAVNGYTSDSVLQWAERIKCYCFEIDNPDCAGMQYQSGSSYHWKKWNCSGTLNYEAWWINGVVYYSLPENLCPQSPPACANYCPCHALDLNDCACWGGPGYCEYCNWGYPSVLCDVVNDKRTTQQKEQGCCPLDPITGEPLDGGFPGSEALGKGAGRPRLCDESCGNPFSVATGNKYEEVLDLTISTPGIPLEFRRSYNSQVIFDNPLGYGWTHTYDVSLALIQTSPTMRVRIWDSDGRALYFSEVQQTPLEITFGGESGVKDRLKLNMYSGEYFLRRKEGNLTYKFDSNGKLLEIFDFNGNALTFTYTGDLLTQVSDNFGKSLSIQYTGNRISSITDPKNQSILYEYTNGDLTKVTYPDQNFVRYAYSNHDLTDKYDTNNNLIGHWGYDNRHRVINYYSHLKDGIPQEEINLTYQPSGTVVTRSTGTTTYTTGVIDEMSVVTGIDGCSTCGSVNKSFQYSNRLDLTHVTSIDGANQYTTQFTYDNPTNPWEQVGEILEVREALGWPEQRTTFYTYTHRTDDPFLLTQSTETIKSVVDTEQNKVITTIYDSQGNIISRQESGYVFINGVPTQKTYTTQYQYNTLGQLTQIDGPRTDVSDITALEYYDNTSGEGNNRGQLKAIVNALNQRTEFSDYDANGNVDKITDPNGVITQRTYDERNRIKTITNLSTGAQTQYFYDIRGNLSYVILPEGNRIDFSYNLANKLTEIKDNLNNKIQYQYDVEGNRIREEVKDPTGILKKYLDFTYDAYNNLKRIIAPDSTYTEYTYDGRKNPTASKDPRNNTISYIYDSLSRLIQMTQPLSTITGYGYDTQDNPSSVTDPNENTTQYFYDDFGRNNQTGSPDTGTTDYLYDEAGNLIQRFDAKETVVNYTYDALNRLTAIQFPSDPNQNVTFTYDSTSVTYGIGRLTGRTDPSGSYTFYYDAHGNLTKEEKTIGGILYTMQYTYNNNNFLTSITYPSGRAITYTPDQIGRISQVSTTLNGNPKTLASAITYLPYGEITGLTYGNGLTLTQGYDNQYRISSIVTGSILNLTFGYDANGNITSITNPDPPGGELLETPGVYSYQEGTNKLTHIEGTPPIDFGYDANANITTENTFAYVYDFSNQLIRVLDNSNQVAEYTYNGAGQRIKKVTPTETRIFHYDLLGHLIAETNQTGQILAEYVYIGDQLLAMIKPGELVYYYHNDHLGKPQVLTDDTGSIAWKAVYTPFGEAVPLIQTIENPFRFPGQYYDPETGLHYNYFRYYNPQTGRYITPDPIGLEGGINLFAYVEGNPVNQIDPEGLSFRGALRGAAKGALYGAGVGAVLGGATGFAVGIVTGPGVLVTTVTGAARGAFEGALLGAFYGSIRGALGLEEDLDPCLLSKAKSKSKPKPENCPTGTKPIDQYPGLSRDDIHRIKRGVGAGPTDWVGITPDGDVITDENGKAVNQGPFKDYLP
jgi:RHS repeat-associated protein